MEKEKKPLYKKWWIWIIVLLVVALIISILYGVGKDVVLDEGKVTYDELQELITDREKELKDITDELESNKDHYNELQELADEEEELLESSVYYITEIASLEAEIEEKEDELNKINSEIAKIKDDPIKVNPGVYYFGDDIETGRYKITNQEGYNGNVFFRGDNSFGETFGKGKYSIEEYTFHAEDGDELEATIPILLYPVE